MFSCLEYGSKFSHCQRNCCNKGASDWLRQLKQVSPHTLKMPWLKGYCFYLPKDSRSCFKRPGLDHFGTLCIHLFWNLQCIRGYQEVMPSWATTPPPNDDVTSGRPLILKLLFLFQTPMTNHRPQRPSTWKFWPEDTTRATSKAAVETNTIFQLNALNDIQS